MKLFLALLPILTLVITLSGLKLKAYQATLSALVVSIVVALVGFGEHFHVAALPITLYNGVRFALVPICLVVLAALFTYGATVMSGGMKTIRTMLASVTDNKRILALLIVFGFGNFIEGMAGFGTAVAIPAAMLVGLGFKPLRAVLMCLVGNTTTTPFGAVGVPSCVLADISGIDQALLVRVEAVLLLTVTAVLPILILLIYGGRAALKGMTKPLLVAEFAFIVPALATASFMGPELPNILGGLSVLLFLGMYATHGRQTPDMRKLGFAALPFVCVIVALGILAILPANCKAYLTPGALILAAGYIGARLQGLPHRRLRRLLVKSACKYWSVFVTTCAVLALARVMEKSCMSMTIAESLVVLTGSAYPFVSTVVGALGGFITGSGTSSCALFGALQADAARALGITPTIVTASNVIGAGIGKMICPQSIALGVASAGAFGAEARVLKIAFRLFLLILAITCVLTGCANLLFCK